MCIYFVNREFTDPLYQNEDYRTQQHQFITILKMKTNSFSMRAGELHLSNGTNTEKKDAYLHIDLRNLQNVKVGFSDSKERYCLHELFGVWSQDRSAQVHKLSTGYKVKNLEEFLGSAYDMLTIKFKDEWKKAS